MKQYIRYIKMTMIALAGLLLSTNIHAQSDLGVVWQKNDYTSSPGGFYNVIPQLDGTYLATGSVEKDGKTVGYIVNINEAGEVINNDQLGEYTLLPSDTWAEWSTGDPWSYISHAYLTSDDCIIAFGCIKNITCDISLKGYSLSGLPLSDTEWLKRGIWIVKVDKKTGAIVYNSLDRGSSEVTGSTIYQAGEQFLIVGMDYMIDGGTNYTGLLRLYNKDGQWIYDNYQSTTGKKVDFQWASIRGKDAFNNYYLSTMDAVMVIDRNDFSNRGNIVTALKHADGQCISNPDPSVTAMYPQVWDIHAHFTPQPDGNFLVMSRMSGLLTSPSVISNYGAAYYEKTSTNGLNFCTTLADKNTRLTKYYFAPYLLPGNSNQYIGSFNNYADGKMYMYQYTDKGNFGEIVDGIQFPYNTDIRAVSLHDGFFSSGSDTDNAHTPAIAKLSSCIKFKINNLPVNSTIIVNHAPNVNVNIPFNFEGAKAATQTDVKYDLQAFVEVGKVNGITPSDNGGELENLSDQTVSSYAGGIGKALDLNRTYTLADGPVVIKYILTIKDSYLTASVPQSCGQTYIFYLRSVPQSEVVAMPTSKIETSGVTRILTSIKNVGKSSFATPYNITIYKDAVGDATKFTYAYPNAIVRGETVDFVIDLPNDPQWNGATNLVLNFNDNGDGTAEQAEADPIVVREYKVK